jgi:hypothetical protein
MMTFAKTFRKGDRVQLDGQRGTFLRADYGNRAVVDWDSKAMPPSVDYDALAHAPVEVVGLQGSRCQETEYAISDGKPATRRCTRGANHQGSHYWGNWTLVGTAAVLQTVCPACGNELDAPSEAVKFTPSAGKPTAQRRVMVLACGFCDWMEEVQ